MPTSLLQKLEHSAIALTTMRKAVSPMAEEKGSPETVAISPQNLPCASRLRVYFLVSLQQACSH